MLKLLSEGQNTFIGDESFVGAIYACGGICACGEICGDAICGASCDERFSFCDENDVYLLLLH